MSGESKSDRSKDKDVRSYNILAAKGVAEVIRTSLGPRGMDKMISKEKNEVIITNDGATILKELDVLHPCGKMLVDLAHAQDVESGDGTTTVTIVAGALLGACQNLLDKGIHPTVIADSFLSAAKKACQVVEGIATPINFQDRQTLLNSATTSLNSKVVSQYSNILSPLAVDSILSIIDPKTDFNVDLRDIRIVKRLGGTMEDTELVKGICFPQKISSSQGGPTRIENAKIGLIQFCLSPPKPNMESNVIITDYTQMDRVLREERNYIVKLIQQIKKSGCNVLLIQKSILRDAVTETSLHYLAKAKILVIKDIERDEVEFVAKTLGCTPIASIEQFQASKLGKADLVEESGTSGGKVVKITGVANPNKTVSVLIRGANRLMIDEAERSLHDALCVLRCLVKKRFTLAGGGSPEIEIAIQLGEWANSLEGAQSYCVKAFAEAFETIPYTLAENAGLRPIEVVTDLRIKHASGQKTMGINVRKGTITDILEENVIQPLLVTTSAIQLATETVTMILKIDDIVGTR